MSIVFDGNMFPEENEAEMGVQEVVGGGSLGERVAILSQSGKATLEGGKE